MEDKELIQQLKKLQRIEPRESFIKENRERILNYINRERESFNITTEAKLKLPIRMLRTISQPALAVFLIVAVLFGGGVMSLYAAKDSKPGDSLYIAKIINEKTQLALTFNQKKKVRLGIEFAGNRAKELSQVLMEEETLKRDEQVEALVNNFKQELKLARMRLDRIQAQEQLGRPEDKLPITTKENFDEPDTAEEDTQEDNGIFSANLGKDEQGVQISESGAGEVTKEPIEEETEELSTVEEVAIPEATTTIPLATTTEEAVEETIGALNPQDLINQVEELLNQEEIDGVEISKLEEAIDQVNVSDEEGEVKGESENATSSEAAIEDTTQESTDEEGEVLGEEESASTTLNN